MLPEIFLPWNTASRSVTVQYNPLNRCKLIQSFAELKLKIIVPRCMCNYLWKCWHGVFFSLLQFFELNPGLYGSLSFRKVFAVFLLFFRKKLIFLSFFIHYFSVFFSFDFFPILQLFYKQLQSQNHCLSRNFT